MTFSNLAKVTASLQARYGGLPPAAVAQGGRADTDVVEAAVRSLRTGTPSAVEVDLLVRHLDVVQQHGNAVIALLARAAETAPPRPQSLFRGLTHHGVATEHRATFVGLARKHGGLDAAERLLLDWMQGDDSKATSLVAAIGAQRLPAWFEERGAKSGWLMPVIESFLFQAPESELGSLDLNSLWAWHADGAFRGILGRAHQIGNRTKASGAGIARLQRVGVRLMAEAARVCESRRDLYKLIRQPIHAEWQLLDPAVLRNLRSMDTGLPPGMLEQLELAESDVNAQAFFEALSDLDGATGERMTFWKYEFPRLRTRGVRFTFTNTGYGREGRLLIKLPDGTIVVEFAEGGSLRFYGPRYPGFDVAVVETAATSSSWSTNEFKNLYTRDPHLRVDHRSGWQDKARQWLHYHLRGGA